LEVLIPTSALQTLLGLPLLYSSIPWKRNKEGQAFVLPAVDSQSVLDGVRLRIQTEPEEESKPFSYSPLGACHEELYRLAVPDD
jgi:hypothetical protein